MNTVYTFAKVKHIPLCFVVTAYQYNHYHLVTPDMLINVFSISEVLLRGS